MHPPFDEDLADAIDSAARRLAGATRVAVLTGAGVSAESGLATFRGAGGLWEGHRVEDVATPRAFRRDPVLVWRFYHQRRADLARCSPNAGHHALVALEQMVPTFDLITQNVDGLHRRAGTRNLHEIHGALRRVRCVGCHAAEETDAPLPDLPTCSACGEMLRPDVVWFEESLPRDVWSQAQRAAERCDVFLTVGTSSQVYPAAGLIATARRNDAKVVEVNLDPSADRSLIDWFLRGPSGEILPQLVSRLQTIQANKSG